MKPLRILATALLLLTHFSYSQILIEPKDEKDSKEALSRPLHISLFDAKENVLKDLNEEEKAEYRKIVAEANELRINAFRKYWTTGQELIFVEESKLAEIIASQPITLFRGSQYQASSAMSTSDAKTQPMRYGIYTAKLDKKKSVAYFPEVRMVVQNELETEMDYKFVLHNLQKFIVAESAGKKFNDESLYDKPKNIATLSTKELWFDKDMLDTVGYSRTEALAEYEHPGKLKFCTGEEIYLAQEQANPTAMFLTYLLSDLHDYWVYAIVDAATMDILAIQPPGRVHFVVGARTDYNDINNAEKFRKGMGPYRRAVKPSVIWQARIKLQLGKRDFKYLASAATVKMNYKDMRQQPGR